MSIAFRGCAGCSAVVERISVCGSGQSPGCAVLQDRSREQHRARAGQGFPDAAQAADNRIETCGQECPGCDGGCRRGGEGTGCPGTHRYASRVRREGTRTRLAADGLQFPDCRRGGRHLHRVVCQPADRQEQDESHHRCSRRQRCHHRADDSTAGSPGCSRTRSGGRPATQDDRRGDSDGHFPHSGDRHARVVAERTKRNAKLRQRRRGGEEARLFEGDPDAAR